MASQDKFASGAIEAIGGIYRGVGQFESLEMKDVRDVVERSISVLNTGANLLEIVGPVRDEENLTAAHVLNVTLLTLFQAELLGLQGDLLMDIGAAALLHDVGSAFLWDQGVHHLSHMDEEQWEKNRTHPTRGATFLARRSEVPRLAVVGAFEHHMRHDGRGYPSVKRRRSGQHTMSRLIAIADFYDILRTERPHRPALEPPVIFALMRKASGSYLSPPLLENLFTACEERFGITG